MALNQPYFVYGEVRDTNNNLLSNADVYATTNGGSTCVKTDSRGRYEINIQNISNNGDTIKITGYSDNTSGSDAFQLDVSQLFKQMNLTLDKNIVITATSEMNIGVS